MQQLVLNMDCSSDATIDRDRFERPFCVERLRPAKKIFGDWKSKIYNKKKKKK
jgi:hypothetical protein